MGGCVNPKTYLLLAAFSLAIVNTTFAGRVVYVDADAPGANDGTSWENAYNFLQDALADANSSDKPVEVWVAQGIYKPTGPSGSREASFHLATGLAVKGGYAGFGEPDPDARDIKAFETILNGDLNGNDVDVNEPCELLDESTRSENCYHVVTCADADASAVLDGFIITGGNANAPTGGSNWPNFHGGGMFNETGSLQISNCIFTANSARYGGGGICSYYACSPNLINCTFIDNSGGSDGGGMCSYHSNPTINNCIFTGNSADCGGGARLGGWSPLVNNCIFIANKAYWNGGGIFCFVSSPILTNCTVSGNKADNEGGGIMFYDGCDPLLNNCILWANTAESSGAQAIVSDSSTLKVSYCNIEGGILGIYVTKGCTMNWEEGNIDTDPCFVDPGYWYAGGVWVDGDYHLLPVSPCINAGDPNYVAEPNATDLDGKPRVIGRRIDMGAYEYRPPISAEVKIVPRTVNLASKGKWINAFLWLPESYNVIDIDSSSVLLEDEIEPQWVWFDEEKQVAVVRFSREEVRDILTIGEVELTITGQLTDGTVFEAKDVIIVIDKGSRKSAK